MAIALDHTIVPARDKVASAEFFARIFGLRYEGPSGHFAPVRINDSLTLDFDNRSSFESHHYAFMVGAEEFEAILARVKEAGVLYGSGPASTRNGQLYNHGSRKGFYFEDPNGHVLEVITRS